MTAGAEVAAVSEKNIIRVNEGAIAVAVAAVICFLGTRSAALVGWPDAGP